MKKNRKPVTAVLLAALLLLAAGCGGDREEPAGDFYTFTDDTGVTVTLAEKPEKVAVLFSSFAEVWQLAGGEVAVTVGESVERGFAAAETPLVDDGAGKTINVELLMAQQPDLVICSADIEAQAEAAALLNQAGIPSACFRVETFGDYLRMLAVCTDITEDKDAYETHGAQVQARIETLLAGVEEQEQRDILFIRAASTASATKAKTAEQHFAAAMLQELGAYNIADNAPVLLDGLSIEEILRADPEIIFISTMGSEEAARAYMDSVLEQPAWQELSAVQSGHVIYLPKDLFQFKPNAGWDKAYEYLLGVLYGA